MNQLLGFVVLTSPLFLIVIWVPVCIGLGIWVGRKFIKKGALVKTAGGVLVFLVALVLPVSDEIAGRIYFNHLCKTQAGVKVYQSIELPAKYWDKDGKPKFFNSYGYLEHQFWTQYLDEDTEGIQYIPNLGIEKDVTIVRSKSSKQEIAQIVTFLAWGGWVARNFSPQNTASSCQFLHTKDFSFSFYSKLFKPKVISGKE